MFAYVQLQYFYPIVYIFLIRQLQNIAHYYEQVARSTSNTYITKIRIAYSIRDIDYIHITTASAAVVLLNC